MAETTARTSAVNIVIAASDRASDIIDGVGVAMGGLQVGTRKVSAEMVNLTANVVQLGTVAAATLAGTVRGSLGVFQSTIQSIRDTLESPVAQPFIQLIAQAAEEATMEMVPLSEALGGVSALTKEFSVGLLGLDGSVLDGLAVKFNRIADLFVQEFPNPFEEILKTTTGLPEIDFRPIGEGIDRTLAETLTEGILENTIQNRIARSVVAGFANSELVRKPEFLEALLEGSVLGATDNLLSKVGARFGKSGLQKTFQSVFAAISIPAGGQKTLRESLESALAEFSIDRGLASAGFEGQVKNFLKKALFNPVSKNFLPAFLKDLSEGSFVEATKKLFAKGLLGVFTSGFNTANKVISDIAREAGRQDALNFLAGFETQRDKIVRQRAEVASATADAAIARASGRATPKQLKALDASRKQAEQQLSILVEAQNANQSFLEKAFSGIGGTAIDSFLGPLIEAVSPLTSGVFGTAFQKIDRSIFKAIAEQRGVGIDQSLVVSAQSFLQQQFTDYGSRLVADTIGSNLKTLSKFSPKIVQQAIARVPPGFASRLLQNTGISRNIFSALTGTIGQSIRKSLTPDSFRGYVNSIDKALAGAGTAISKVLGGVERDASFLEGRFSAVVKVFRLFQGAANGLANIVPKAFKFIESSVTGAAKRLEQLTDLLQRGVTKGLTVFEDRAIKIFPKFDLEIRGITASLGKMSRTLLSSSKAGLQQFQQAVAGISEGGIATGLEGGLRQVGGLFQSLADNTDDFVQSLYRGLTVDNFLKTLQSGLAGIPQVFRFLQTQVDALGATLPRAFIGLEFGTLNAIDALDGFIATLQGGIPRALSVLETGLTRGISFLESATAGVFPAFILKVWDAIAVLENFSNTIFSTVAGGLQQLRQAIESAFRSDAVSAAVATIQSNLERLSAFLSNADKAFTRLADAVPDVFAGIEFAVVGAIAQVQQFADLLEGGILGGLSQLAGRGIQFFPQFGIQIFQVTNLLEGLTKSVFQFVRGGLQPLRQGVEGIFQGGVVSNLVGGLQSGLRQTATFLGTLATNSSSLAASISNIFLSLEFGAVGAIAQLEKLTGTLQANVAGALKNLGTTTIRIFPQLTQQVWETISALEAFSDRGLQSVRTGLQQFRGIVENLFRGDVGANALEGLQSGLRGLSGLLGGLADDSDRATQPLIKGLDSARQALQVASQRVLDFTAGLRQGLRQSLSPLIDNYEVNLQRLSEFAQRFGDRLATGINQGLKKVIVQAGQFAEAFTKFAFPKLRSAFNTLDKFLEGSLSTAMQEIGRNAATAYASGFSAVLFEQISPALDAIADRITNTVTQVRGIARQVSGALGGISAPLFQASGIDRPIMLFNMMKEAVGGVTSGVLRLGEEIAFFSQGFQALQSVVIGGPFQALIGQTIELREQLLATQSSLVATSKIFAGGAELTDPGQAIEALSKPIADVIGQMRRESLELVGVTSKDLVPLFDILAGQMNAIGGGLGDVKDLTLDFAASLGTLGVPLDQARQEISSIAAGTIDMNSILAKSLNITNEQVNKWKQQGEFVEQLRKRLEPFRAGNALAAQTIKGVFSNIQESFDEITRTAGEPLLEPIVAQLTRLYNAINPETDEGARNIETLTEKLGGIVSRIERVFSAIVGTVETVFGATRGVVEETIFYLAESIAVFAEKFQSSIERAAVVLEPFINILESLFDKIGALANPLVEPLINLKLLEVGVGTLGRMFGWITPMVFGLGEAMDLTDARGLGLVRQFGSLRQTLGTAGAGFLVAGKNLASIPGGVNAVARSLGPLGAIIAPLIPQFSSLGIQAVGFSRILQQMGVPINQIVNALFAVAPALVRAAKAFVQLKTNASLISPVIKPLLPLFDQVAGKLDKISTASRRTELLQNSFKNTLQGVGRSVATQAVSFAAMTGGTFLLVQAFDKLVLQNKDVQEAIAIFMAGLQGVGEVLGALASGPFLFVIEGFAIILKSIAALLDPVKTFQSLLEALANPMEALTEGSLSLGKAISALGTALVGYRIAAALGIIQGIKFGEMLLSGAQAAQDFAKFLQRVRLYELAEGFSNLGEGVADFVNFMRTGKRTTELATAALEAQSAAATVSGGVAAGAAAANAGLGTALGGVATGGGLAFPALTLTGAAATGEGIAAGGAAATNAGLGVALGGVAAGGALAFPSLTLTGTAAVGEGVAAGGAAIANTGLGLSLGGVAAGGGLAFPALTLTGAAAVGEGVAAGGAAIANTGLGLSLGGVAAGGALAFPALGLTGTAAAGEGIAAGLSAIANTAYAISLNAVSEAADNSTDSLAANTVAAKIQGGEALKNAFKNGVKGIKDGFLSLKNFIKGIKWGGLLIGLKAGFTKLLPILSKVGLAIAKIAAPITAVVGAIVVAGLVKRANDLRVANEALEIHAGINDRLANSALNLAYKLKTANERLEESRESGIALTQEEYAENERLLKQKEGEIQAINARIAELQELRDDRKEGAKNDSQRAAYDAQIAGLESVRQALEEQAGTIEIAPKDLPELGTELEQLESKANSAFEALNNPQGDQEVFKQKAQEVVDLTKRQLELGLITEEEARARLEAVANNSKVEREVQEAAQQAITETYQSESQKRIDAIEQQENAIAAAVAEGTLSEQEAQRQSNQLTIQTIQEQKKAQEDAHKNRMKQIQDEIEAQRLLNEQKVQEMLIDLRKLSAQIETAKGDERTALEKQYQAQVEAIAEFQAQAKDAEGKAQNLANAAFQEEERKHGKTMADLKKQEAEARKQERDRANEEELKDFEEQIAILEAAQSKGVDNEREIFKVQEQRVEAEIDQQKAKLDKLAEDDKEGREAINAEIARLEVEKAEILEAAAQAEIDRLERQMDKALDILKSAEKSRTIELTKLRNKGAISEAEFSERSAEERIKNVEAELQAQRNFVAQLERMPKPRDPKAAAERENQIREERLKTQDLMLEAIESEQAAYEAHIENMLSKLDKAQTQQRIKLQKLINSGEILQEEAAERSVEMEIQRLQKEIALNKRDKEKRLQLQLELEEAREKLLDARIATLKRVLDEEIQAFENRYNRENQELQKQQALYDSINKALEIRNQLFDAQRGLQGAATSFLESQLNAIAAGEQSEYRRRQIAEITAAIKLKAAQQQILFDRQALEIEIQRQKLALEREQIQNRIAQSEAAAEVARANAELAIAAADPRTTQAQLEALQLQRNAAQLRLRSTEQEGILLQQQAAQQEQIFDMQRRQQAFQERQILTEAESQYIATLPPGKRQRAQRQQQERLMEEVFGARSRGEFFDQGIAMSRALARDLGYDLSTSLGSAFDPELEGLRDVLDPSQYAAALADTDRRRFQTLGNAPFQIAPTGVAPGTPQLQLPTEFTGQLGAAGQDFRQQTVAAGQDFRQSLGLPPTGALTLPAPGSTSLALDPATVQAMERNLSAPVTQTLSPQFNIQIQATTDQIARDIQRKTEPGMREVVKEMQYLVSG